MIRDNVPNMQATVSKDVTEQTLSPGLQRAVQILSATYETLDLRIETTLGAAEADFFKALPEIQNHKEELRQFITFLLSDLRLEGLTPGSEQPLFIRFAFQDEDDLIEQLLSGAKAQIVVVPVDGETSLHTNIQGFHA